MIVRWPCIVVAMLCCSLAVACERTEPKPLAERMLDVMIERCKKMAQTAQRAECENLAGSTTLEAINNLHRIMIRQITTTFPRDGFCLKHGFFLVCTERLLDGKPRSVLYRLNDATDGSDSRIMFVWSQEW